MSSQITTTKTFLNSGQWQVEAVVEAGGVLPAAIWLYEVDENGDLGLYAGVSDKRQLSSRAVWTGTPVDTFGNRFIRHDEMSRVYPTEEIADQVIQKIVTDATKLSTELSESSAEIVTHDIP